MARKKADGTAFEKEFKDAVKKKYCVRRLHTSFTPNPADFVVLGKTFNYAEVKETAADSFSIASLQQLSEIKKFVEDRNTFKSSIVAKSHYWVIVHFLKYSLIKVIEANQALELLSKRETLKPSTDCSTYSNLKELVEGGLF